MSTYVIRKVRTWYLRYEHVRTGTTHSTARLAKVLTED